MSNHRGRPLPWALRQEIGRRVARGETRRQVALELRLSKTTVQRYAGKFGTEMFTNVPLITRM
jgi:FixJ family two-component response regulator